MESTLIREEKAKRLYRWFLAFYCLFCAALLAIYIARRDSYHWGITCGTFAVPLGIALIWRLPFLHRVWQLDCVILGFAFITYPLGACLDFYRILPGFDKVAHGLSGTFASLLALDLYYALKPGHRIERNDTALAITFMFFASVAVAGLWEIGEFLVARIVKLDLQRVEKTGISDSMWDMIVCMAGTVAAIPIALRVCRGKSGIFSNAVRDAVAINFQ